MKKGIQYLGLVLATLFSCNVTFTQSSPNVLWVLTDDQRYDAISAFNQILHGRDSSELGYVESPRVDQLAAQGTTFINTYCQATGCAPSRASMLYGRYPFRSGVYEFEYHNNVAEHCEPSLPEQMENLGYQTLHVGKLGFRIKTIKDGRTVPHAVSQQSIYFKDLGKDRLTDWGKDWFYELDGKKLKEPIKNLEYFITPDGERYFVSEQLSEPGMKYAGVAEKLQNNYDVLRHYNPSQSESLYQGIIISGVSPQPAGKTRDGYYAHFFGEYLKQENTTFNVGSKTFSGIDPSKPLFAHIGFDFPHTPVLPPASFRERFQQHTYQVPDFDEKEFAMMPKQLQKQVRSKYSDHLSDKDKQKMVQDYYAFCAYGDQLIGQVADDFIAYSEKHDQEWMIVYVCGDHGWKLNDHGAISKFSTWEIDSHNPIIVVASDKGTFPAGKVVSDFTEFVDIAPTILSAAGAQLKTAHYAYLDGLNMAKVADQSVPARDYVIGESHAVTGPRAYIRTKDYVFSMQTRPDKERGKNFDWARTASYTELDPALYRSATDPREVNNLAFNPQYQSIAHKMKEKLINIVLGDGRVEVIWGPKADGVEVHYSNFAPGAHDHRLKLE
ncbi:MAG: sulfatase-like hydrolase/transferase [Bacteroidota bacterium]